jgi:ribosome-associated protein
MTKPARKARPARKPGNQNDRRNRQALLEALRACENKKAGDLTLLAMDQSSGAFTDYFVICSGSNPRQIQAIADEVQQKLRPLGFHPAHTEGYTQAEWVLLDYVDLVVHIFSPAARKFYDLERLWKSAKRLESGDLKKSPRRTRLASRKRTVSSRSKSRVKRATARRKRAS